MTLDVKDDVGPMELSRDATAHTRKHRCAKRSLSKPHTLIRTYELRVQLKRTKQKPSHAPVSMVAKIGTQTNLN